MPKMTVLLGDYWNCRKIIYLFIIYFVHQVQAAINSSQLKPNDHNFLKLVFRSCKVENIYVHKLVGLDRAIFVIVSSNSESQFLLFDTEIWPNAKTFQDLLCQNELFHVQKWNIQSLEAYQAVSLYC